MLQRWNSLLSSKVLVHTHVNCMCINKIEVMFGGSCINVKLNLSKVQRDSTFKLIYMQPHYLYFIYARKFHPCMHVKIIRQWKSA